MAIDPDKQNEQNLRQEEFDARAAEIMAMKISDAEKLRLIEEARLEILAEQLTVSQSITESIKELFGLKSKISESEKYTLDLAKQVQNLVKGQSSESQSVEESQKKQNKAQDVLNKLKTQSITVEGDLGKQQLTNVKYAHTRGQHLVEDKARLSANLKLLAQGATHDRDGNLMSKERLQAEAKAIATEDKKLNTRINNMNATQKEALYLRQQGDIANEVLKNEEKREEAIKKVNNAMGLTGNALGIINKLTGGALGPTKEIEKQTKKELEQLDKKGELLDGFPGKMQGFAITLKNAGKALVDNLIDPMVIFMQILEGSKAIANLQQDLGLAYGEAMNLEISLREVAAYSDDIYMTNTKIKASYAALRSELGFTVDHTGEILETMTNLTGRFGMANKEAARMTGLLRLQGENTEKISMDIQNSLHQTIQMGDVAFTVKDVFNDIGKASSAVQISLGGSVEAIGEAVIQSKKLGLELKDIEGIAKSLLDFEQSIEKELTAELLLGRQINLEKARLYALTNDYVNLGKELEKQNITFSEFGDMNYKQQESIADAMGMSRDTMSDMLMRQELMGLSNDEIKDQYGDQVAEQMKALSAADKFALAMENIKDMVANLAIAFAPVIDFVAMLAENAALTLGILGALAGLSFAKMIASMTVMVLQMQMFSLGAITSTSALTFGLGLVAVMAAVGVALGLMSSQKSKVKSESMADGLIPGTQSGYGKRVLFEEGKMPVAFNDKDTLVASTKVTEMSDGLVSGIATKMNVSNKDSDELSSISQKEKTIEKENVKPIQSTAINVNAPPVQEKVTQPDFSKLESTMKDGFTNLTNSNNNQNNRPLNIHNNWDKFGSAKSSNLLDANNRSATPETFAFAGI
jgi:hypothetical protein